MKRQGKEAELVKLVLNYLSHKHIWSQRNSTGGLRTPGGKYISVNKKGTPDITARMRPVHPHQGSGRVIWIECKTDEGKQSKEQLDFQREAERHGDTYVVARCLEDVMALFERPKK